MISLGKKRRRDREASTQALLEAAIQVFSEVGYDAATTREVAKRAGVSEALIQRYFESKAGLLLAVMKAFAEKDGGMGLASLPYQETLEEELSQVLAFACKMHQTHQTFLKVALSRAIVDPILGQELRTSVHEIRLPILVARLRHYQSKGLIAANADLDSLAYGVFAIGFSTGFMGPFVFGFDESKMKQVVRCMTQALGRGSAP